MSLALAHTLSNGIFLSLVVGIPLYGMRHGVKVYDAFIEGGKEGLPILVNVLPHFVALLVAVGMLRASGVFDGLAHVVGPLMRAIGFPVELLPLALLRPFSGSASNALLVDTIAQHGPDSLLSRTAATLIGSTETTFYVLAVYFGAVGIKKMRHAAICGLLADLAGMIAAVVVCRLLF